MEDKSHWKNILIDKKTSIFSAIKYMDVEALRVLLVVNESQQLLGIITDGDIRRHLLRQASLELPVEQIMNRNPITASIAEQQEQLLEKMKKLGILHLPIVDNENRVVGLETINTILNKNSRDNWVIFMAGGAGKRLYPLTLNCPKPLLKIGDKPIAEILLENFIKSGFKNFYFSVNYKSEMLREYFGSGERWRVNIHYIEESAALGTAGSLSLLNFKPNNPFFVVNADILTNIHFGHILDFHEQYRSKLNATICVREHQNIIPFGLVHIDKNDHRLISIEEKPIKNYFVNAGIYILEPEMLNHLTFNTYCDMPAFLTHLAKEGFHINTFPVREYWLDIGHHDHLVRASSDYIEVFSNQ